MKKYLYIINCFFNKKLRDNKLFFKKTSYINKYFCKHFFDYRNIFNFFFSFSNKKLIKLIQNKFIVITLNNVTISKINEISLNTGDVIKFSFSEKFLYTVTFLYLFKFSWAFKKFSKLKKTRKDKAKKFKKFKIYKKFKFASIKTKPYWLKYNELIYKNIDFSFLNFNFFYLFNINFFKYSYIFKKLLNIYSWRLYKWDFK